MKRVYQWQMDTVRSPFVMREVPWPTPSPSEAVVEIAGCGVCHTDLSFWHDGVRTRKAMPLTLGHEISGKVVDGTDEWIGRQVIIPAVLPCGECDLCRKGRSNICQHQIMPGNDIHGGFASHILVPHRFLCHVPEEALQRYTLADMAVVADAISTPYQAIKKSELQAGDLAVVIGVGGIGVYAAMLANGMGAKVVAIDISDQKLQITAQYGISATINSNGNTIKDIKNKLKTIAHEMDVPDYAWKIFEMSGTKAGQELAYSLITHAGTLSIVGFTMDKLEVRLSNLMAFDAKVIGTWGCKPELYADVVDLIATHKLHIHDFVQKIPMSRINEVFVDTLNHKYHKRTVLTPDFN